MVIQYIKIPAPLKTWSWGYLGIFLYIYGMGWNPHYFQSHSNRGPKSLHWRPTFAGASDVQRPAVLTASSAAGILLPLGCSNPLDNHQLRIGLQTFDKRLQNNVYICIFIVMYIYIYVIYMFKTTRQSIDWARSFRYLRKKNMSTMSFAACSLIPQTCEAWSGARQT